jgi:hypothetical protein
MEFAEEFGAIKLQIETVPRIIAGGNIFVSNFPIIADTY